jgi:hypothetical protein
MIEWYIIITFFSWLITTKRPFGQFLQKLTDQQPKFTSEQLAVFKAAGVAPIESLRLKIIRFLDRLTSCAVCLPFWTTLTFGLLSTQILPAIASAALMAAAATVLDYFYKNKI